MEIFRIRNTQLNTQQHVEYSLELINPKNMTEVLDEYFQLKLSTSYNAHLLLIKEMNSTKEIDLEIEMKIFTNDFLSSISMMKLAIYLSQFNFYP